MKTSTIFGLFVACATTASAIPVKPRHGQVEITFVGAANAQFTQSFPSDGSTVSIGRLLFIASSQVKPYDINLTSSGNPLSISHISSSTAGIQCTFNGIDHSVTMVHGAQWVDVGPPQTQVTGSCQTQESDSPPAPPATPPTPPTPPAEDQVHVTFFGAADAQFSQSFPMTGELVKISTFIYTSYVTK